MRKTVLFIAFLLALTGCGEAAYLTEEPESEFSTEAVSEAEEMAAENAEETAATAFVYVCGEVENPGVYEVATGSRIFEAVSLAGGLTADADVDAVNQAEVVSDQQMIRIPVIGEEPSEAAEAAVSDGKINLNTATREELMTLPGIGESKAASILSYREEHGSFSDITDLMNIPGIKDGVFSKLKEKVKV